MGTVYMADQTEPVERRVALKIIKPEARIDWARSALELYRRVRACNPFPVCYSDRGGERVRGWRSR
ncbi:MAG: hypothetical protein ABFS30_02765 [Pseudomonadota bacterium]